MLADFLFPQHKRLPDPRTLSLALCLDNDFYVSLHKSSIKGCKIVFSPRF